MASWYSNITKQQIGLEGDNFGNIVCKHRHVEDLSHQSDHRIDTKSYSSVKEKHANERDNENDLRINGDVRSSQLNDVDSYTKVEVNGEASGQSLDAGDSGFSCDDHPDMAVEAYCGTHDVVVCITCSSSKHRFCRDVIPLSEIDIKPFKKKDLKKSTKELSEIRESLMKIRQSKREELKRIEAETAKAIQDLQEFKELINWLLERRERKGRMHIENRHKELTRDIKEDLEECDKMMADIEKQLRKSSKHDDEKSKRKSFVKTKKTNQLLSRLKNNASTLKASEESRSLIKFTVDPKVEQFAQSLAWYGKDKTYLSCEPTLAFPHLYEVKGECQYDVRVKGDRNVCVVTSVCQMLDGTLLLADNSNSKIKQLDVLYQIVDSIQLSAPPLVILALGDVKAVVAIDTAENSVLQLVNVESRKLSTSDSFTVYGKCCGLGFDGEHIYVASETAIVAYSQSGETVGEIYSNPHTTLTSLSYSSALCKLVVANNDGEILVLERTGEIVRQIADEIFTGHCAIAVDVNGQILVASYTSNSVVQFNHCLARQGVVLDPANGVRTPLAVIFDRLHSRLVLTMKGKNFVKIFDLK
ncbi:uncharacterized protein LOC127874686 [Dreissena polymorpha]|uniref:B box-type domain-containing protein n=1 Tax=Dreissena polymorpha TaxID=45954 RepID=A0A9D4L3E6_DREPO|nr:uncharacterized protein LOC127874686 [Dreissena polymorpha]KAH3851210.1 hypothetical protein DPMN_093689 [Dreissena polymorpha]